MIPYLVLCLLGPAVLLAAGLEGTAPRIVAVVIMAAAGVVLGMALEARTTNTPED